VLAEPEIEVTPLFAVFALDPQRIKVVNESKTINKPALKYSKPLFSIFSRIFSLLGKTFNLLARTMIR
jgi:hypothetical protein